MARLNVEDSIYKDFRFQELIIKVGNRHTAKGMLLEFWTLAQEYWVSDQKGVPALEMERHGLWPVLEVGLGEKAGEFITAIGANKHFDWLLKRKLAGQRGGAKKASNRLLQFATAEPSKPKQTLPSLLSSLTLYSNTKPKTEECVSRDTPLPLLAEIWNENRGKLPEVKNSNRARHRKAESRWRENPNRDYWTEIIKLISTNSFCTGSNDRGWFATFDWLLKPETHLNVSEGKYSQKSQDEKWVPKEERG